MTRALPRRRQRVRYLLAYAVRGRARASRRCRPTLTLRSTFLLRASSVSCLHLVARDFAPAVISRAPPALFKIVKRGAPSRGLSLAPLGVVMLEPDVSSIRWPTRVSARRRVIWHAADFANCRRAPGSANARRPQYRQSRRSCMKRGASSFSPGSRRTTLENRSQRGRAYGRAHSQSGNGYGLRS